MVESIQNSIGDLRQDGFSREMYFPTMVFNVACSDHEQLNRYLLNLIYSERARDQDGIERSNFKGLGGWHSHNNLHKDPAYRPLTDRIHQAGERISAELGYARNKHLRIGTMWSIINPPGSSNKVHVHPGCLWSGVYYIQTPTKAGDIEFTDPRTANVMEQPSFIPNQKRPKETWTKVRFTPQAGRMLIFPSWLYHGVDPNLSEEQGQAGERIIISFNLSQVG